MRLAEALVSMLASAGIDTVFGIPGVHNLSLYRALGGSTLKHLTARHEQGAGFMADGYARATGRPAACFVITGPGLTNIATAMGQALGDSIPMLVIATSDRRDALGLGQGRLHEVAAQFAIGAAVARHAFRLHDPAQFDAVMMLCLAALTSGRPGPVYLEIPRDLLDAELSTPAREPPRIAPPAPDPLAIDALAERIAGASRPMLVIGGGSVAAGDRVQRFAERIGAPVVATINGKGTVPPGHPLAVPGSPSLSAVRTLLADADLTIAIGTELGETDFDYEMTGTPAFGGALVRIDIDPHQLVRNAAPDLAIMADARLALDALLARVPARPDTRAQAGERVRRMRADVAAARTPAWSSFLDVLADVWRDGIIAGDSTQPTYQAWLYHDAPAPRRYFHSASGYGTLGYGLPAGIGAASADTGRPVLVLIGDGGLQFTLAELMVAVAASLRVCVLVWDNSGYEEIRRFMVDAQIAPIGVAVRPPAIGALAASFACPVHAVDSAATLRTALLHARHHDGPTLVHVAADAYLTAAGDV